MKKLNEFLLNLEPKVRLYLGHGSSFAGDLLIIFYITKVIDTFVTKDLVFKQLSFLGYQAASLSHTDFLQFKGILTANVKLMLFAAIVVHGIIYACGCLKKKWAINYVERYALFGAVLSTLEFIFYIKNGNGLNPYTFGTILFYGLSYLSLRAFKKQER